MYKVGDTIKYDSNPLGAPRIGKGTIVSISSGFATHSDPNPPRVIKIKKDDGTSFSIDETQIITENNDRYEYKGYDLVDNYESGSWDVIDSETGEVKATGFSVEQDARDYVDSMDEYEYEDESYELPVNTTTRKVIENKYKDLFCEAYVLKSSEYGGVYAAKNNKNSGLGHFDDPGLLVYKTRDIAERAKSHTKSKYYVMKVIIGNGYIKFSK